MKTRIGKVARLSKSIRDELNHRFDNGADGPELLAWLNALPEVQRVLAEKFGGRPLTKQNLSDWRRGGYAEWAANRDGRAQWQDLLQQGCELTQKRTSNGGTDVTGYLGTFLIVELHEAINELHKMKNSDQRWKVLQMISRALARLQNAHSRDKRIRLWETKEQKCRRQIATSRPESPSKKFIFQSCHQSDAPKPEQHNISAADQFRL
jgi:hypothetical protein